MKKSLFQKDFSKKTIRSLQESKFYALLYNKPGITLLVLFVIQLLLVKLVGPRPNNVFVDLLLLLINFLIATFFVLIIVHTIRNSLRRLMNPTHIRELIFAYIFLIFSFLLIFSTLFSVVEFSKLGYLRYGGCTDTTSLTQDVAGGLVSRDFLYFSTMTFFTVGYGDICPIGSARIVAMIEAFVGHVISVILVALIINNYLQSRKKE